jgi:hypothetical protein
MKELYMCVCVCVCARARVRVHVHACTHACMYGMKDKIKMSEFLISSLQMWQYTNKFTYLPTNTFNIQDDANSPVYSENACYVSVPIFLRSTPKCMKLTFYLLLYTSGSEPVGCNLKLGCGKHRDGSWIFYKKTLFFILDEP